MQINNFNVILTSHALERAKQRIKLHSDLDIDKNSIVYKFKIIELFKKAPFYYDEDHFRNYVLHINNQKIIFKTKIKNSEIIIVTIIVNKI